VLTQSYDASCNNVIGCVFKIHFCYIGVILIDYNYLCILFRWIRFDGIAATFNLACC